MKWIKCADRLPELEVHVLCFSTIKTNAHSNMHVGYRYERPEILFPDLQEYERCAWTCFGEVTHWMPFPEAPNGLD